MRRRESPPCGLCSTAAASGTITARSVTTMTATGASAPS
jgi:hypothetical protein